MLPDMLALVPLLIASSAANADIRPLLRHQGFIRPLNGREKIEYVGHIRQGGNDYEIYSYFGLFFTGVIDHASSDLIVILNNSTFLGEYKVAMPTRCRIRGQKVICNTDDVPPIGRHRDVVEFTRHGPPYEILFDGEVDSFEYGNRVKAHRCNDRPCARLEKWAHAPGGR